MCAASAYATGPGPSVSISGYSGSIHGTVSSVSNGSSVVATQVNGYGSSTQTSFGETGGVAQASGSFSHNGIETVTSTRQYATSETYGHVSGNAPIMSGDSIANGGATFEDRHERFRHGIVPCGDFRRDGVDPRDRRDWPLQGFNH